MLEDRVIAGRYRLDAPLGRGGHAEVFEAVHVETGLVVAVKLLRPTRHGDPQITARFEREVRLVSRLRHPNTVRALESGRHGDALYLVMELVDGRTLAREVADRGRLDVGRALHIARQIAASAGEAHAEGLVHRDLKPDNVLLVNHFGLPDHVKVVDFGVAHELDADSLTTGDALVGTPAWMAPEQWLSGDVDARTDLYAVGALLHFMLTGAPPFGHATGSGPAASVALMEAHIHRAPPRVQDLVPECPTELSDLVARLLAKRPADRPADAAETLMALDALTARPRTTVQNEVAPRRTRNVVPTFGIGGVIGATGAVVAAFALGRATLSDPVPAQPVAVADPVTTKAPDPDTLQRSTNNPSQEITFTSAPIVPAEAGRINVSAPDTRHRAPTQDTELLLTTDPPGAKVTVVETGALLIDATPSSTVLSPELRARLAAGKPVTLEFQRPGHQRERRPLSEATLTSGELAVVLAPHRTSRLPERELPPLRTP